MQFGKKPDTYTYRHLYKYAGSLLQIRLKNEFLFDVSFDRSLFYPNEFISKVRTSNASAYFYYSREKYQQKRLLLRFVFLMIFFFFFFFNTPSFSYSISTKRTVVWSENPWQRLSPLLKHYIGQGLSYCLHSCAMSDRIKCY